MENSPKGGCLMPVYALGNTPELFPPAEGADPSGLVAVGGDLSPRRLLAGYRQGIFPWYEQGVPILWHSPDPRFVLDLERFHLPGSLKKVIRRDIYQVRYDTDFEGVMRGCATARRPGQRGTWITDEMIEGYVELHRLGHAHSAESWSSGILVGGLYGVALGSIFFGESMFARAADASKVAFAVLVEQLKSWGFTLVDCQMETEHLARFGAESWTRSRFLETLQGCLKSRTEITDRQGPWTFG